MKVCSIRPSVRVIDTETKRVDGSLQKSHLLIRHNGAVLHVYNMIYTEIIYLIIWDSFESSYKCHLLNAKESFPSTVYHYCITTNVTSLKTVAHKIDPSFVVNGKRQHQLVTVFGGRNLASREEEPT